MKKDNMMKNEKKRMNTPKTLEMIMNKAVSAKQMVQHKRFNRKFLAKTPKSTENIQKSKRDMLQRHASHLFRGDLSVDTHVSPCAQNKGQTSLYTLSFSIDFLSLVLPNMQEIHIRSLQNQSDELVPTLVSLSSETSGGDSIASEHTGQTALGKDRVQETINCASNIDCFFNSQSPRSVDALECTSSIPINVDFVLESNEEEIASFANERIQRRHYRDAIDIYESVLSHFRKCYGNDHQLVMDTLNNLCISNTLNGNYSQALSYGIEALSLRRKNLGKNHMDVASSLSELGIVYYAREDFDKSLSSFREAMRIYSKAPDCAERSTRICSLLNNIGCVHYSMGKVATSLSTFNECLGLQRSFMGKLTGDTMSKVLYNMSITLCNTGIVTSKQGNLDNALSLLEEGLMVQYSVLPDDHRMITTVQKAKKRLECIREPLSPKMEERIKLEFDIDPQEKGNSKNRSKEALGMYEMDIDQEWNGYCADMISLGSIRVEPESHQQISLNMNINTLSQALTNEGRSKRHCSWVDVRKSKSFPSEKGGDFFQITSNACKYIERGDLENAIRVFENARKGAKNKCGDVEYILAAISHCMGIIYLYTGSYHQALACFKHAIQMRSKVLDKDAIDLMVSNIKFVLPPSVGDNIGLIVFFFS
jgi:tetratricopeptide (TPR) repeat protein